MPGAIALSDDGSFLLALGGAAGVRLRAAGCSRRGWGFRLGRAGRLLGRDDRLAFQIIHRLRHLPVFLAAVLGQFRQLVRVFLEFGFEQAPGFFLLAHIFFDPLGVGRLVAGADLVLVVDLAHAQRGVGVAALQRVNLVIRGDALALDRLAVGGVVARRGELERGIGPERQHGLHRALAEGQRAHDHCTLVVLQGASHDFGGRCRSAVDEHHQFHRLNARGQGVERVVARAAHVVTRGVAVGGVGLGHLPLGADDHGVVRQEHRSHAHGAFEQTARIVAQIEDQALHVRVFLIQRVDFFDEAAQRVRLELGDTNPAIARGDHLALDALYLNQLAGHGEGEGAVFRLAQHGEGDLGTRLAAHELDRVAQAQTLDGGIVDAGNQVARMNASPGSRRALDGRNHFHQTIFGGDFDAHADEFAAGAFLEVLEVLLIQIFRVWIEVVHHAVDGVFDQFLALDRLKEVGLDQPVHGGELLQFFQR